MNKKNKRRRRCQDCKQLKRDVCTVEDPFMKEIWNKVVVKAMCGSCRQESADAV